MLSLLLWTAGVMVGAMLIGWLRYETQLTRPRRKINTRPPSRVNYARIAELEHSLGLSPTTDIPHWTRAHNEAVSNRNFYRARLIASGEVTPSPEEPKYQTIVG